MPISLHNVRIPQVPQLREIVDVARMTPTGSKVMDDLAGVRTNLELFTPEEWRADPSLVGSAGAYRPDDNTLMLPTGILDASQGPLLASAADPHLAARAEILVHEGVHRLQSSRLMPAAMHALAKNTVEPWRMIGAGFGAAVNPTPGPLVEKFLAGAARVPLRKEVDAFVVQGRHAAELAEAGGTPVAPWDVPTPESAERWIMQNDMYQEQAVGSMRDGIAALKRQGIVAAGTGAVTGLAFGAAALDRQLATD